MAAASSPAATLEASAVAARGGSDARTAGTVTYLTPLVAIIVGVLVLGERITWNEPLGGVPVVIEAAIA